MLARSSLLGLACVALAMTFGPAVVSAAREPASSPDTLLEAFPLNPTGERIVARGATDPGVLRPPEQRVAVARSSEGGPAGDGGRSGADTFVLAAIGGAGVVVLLAAVGLVSALQRLASGRASPTSDQEPPSAYISAVFIGTRRVPIVERVTRPDRDVAWTAAVVSALAAGCATAVAVALLVVM
jgi:hypothetical protein